MESTSRTPTSRLLHTWAILTAVAALPLLFLGAEVTSKGVGMVDQVGLRTPWYFFERFLNESLGWRIEHSHRLVGWIVGACVIVLVILASWLGRRPGVTFFSLGILAAVCLQGALGIFRIQLNAILGPALAFIHGLFAPIVFTLLVLMAMITSGKWSGVGLGECSPRVRLWALITVGLVFAQMLLGGLVRHMDLALGARAHALGAFAVFGAVIVLAKLAADEHAGSAWKLLLALVVAQILLGVEAWLSKFFVATAPWNQTQPLTDREIVRSLHYVVGAMILATSAAFALSVNRRLGLAKEPTCARERSQPQLESLPRLEGIA